MPPIKPAPFVCRSPAVARRAARLTRSNGPGLLAAATLLIVLAVPRGEAAGRVPPARLAPCAYEATNGPFDAPWKPRVSIVRAAPADDLPAPAHPLLEAYRAVLQEHRCAAAAYLERIGAMIDRLRYPGEGIHEEGTRRTTEAATPAKAAVVDRAARTGTTARAPGAAADAGRGGAWLVANQATGPPRPGTGDRAGGLVVLLALAMALVALATPLLCALLAPRIPAAALRSRPATMPAAALGGAT